MVIQSREINEEGIYSLCFNISKTKPLLAVKADMIEELHRISLSEVFPIPRSLPPLVGITLIRNETIPVIDLTQLITGIPNPHLDLEAKNTHQAKIPLIITEYESAKIGFVVYEVHNYETGFIQQLGEEKEHPFKLNEKTEYTFEAPIQGIFSLEKPKRTSATTKQKTTEPTDDKKDEENQQIWFLDLKKLLENLNETKPQEKGGAKRKSGPSSKTKIAKEKRRVATTPQEYDFSSDDFDLDQFTLPDSD